MTHKRILVLLTALFVVTTLTQANPVDLKTAREVALKFMNANTKTPLRGPQDLQLVKTYNIDRGEAAFHVFNTPNGFVIVSADDCATPILGYSDEGRPFDIDNVPIQLQDLFNGYLEQFQYGIDNPLEATEAVAQQWRQVKATGRLNNDREGDYVEPLITTQWDQWYPYNALCPLECPTGCTATATAQIVNYWQYPSKGVGYCTYEPRSGVGKQSAWFNETYYQWDLMDVDHVEVISTLMYHVGVASHMDYSFGSSGAQIYEAEAGLQNYFDYSNSSFWARKEDYLDTDWHDMLVGELINGRPILYDGYNGSYTLGHAWVVDGCDANGLFHMNFGWSGASDGYYALDAQPTGFSFFQTAVLGIQPAYSNLSADFQWFSTNSMMEYQFVDFSKGNASTYHWDFGDGNTSSVQNPVYQYDSEGVYTTTLIVSDGLEYDTMRKEIQVVKLPFYPTDLYIAPNDAMSIPVVLDYDMDGKLDLYISGYLGTYLYHNEDSVFRSVPNDFEGPNVYSYTSSVVDLFKDNRPSILNSINHGVFLFNDNGVLEQTYTPACEVVNNMDAFSFGDYDGDGDDDVLVYYEVFGSSYNKATLYKNIGNGSFCRVNDTEYAAQMWYDYDGDGDFDMIGRTIYRNDGNEIFTPVFTINISPGLKIDVADMNRDGNPDIVFENNILYYLGNDTFAHNIQEDCFIPIMNSSETHAVDFNCDGLSDVVDKAISHIFIYENKIDSLNSVFIEQPQFNYSANTCFIDYDNNNVPDFFHCGVHSLHEDGSGLGFVSVLMKNSCSVTNVPPAIPNNLWEEVSGNSVVLHWDTVSDDHCCYGSITYNIMVGTSPNGFDIKSPLSNIETGKRFVYNKGNAGHVPLWKLNDLPNGTYYWRVQAIDNSLAASMFSEMGSFVIDGTNLPPEIAGFSAVTSLNRELFFVDKDIKDYYYDKEGDTLQGIQIVSLPLHGTLRLNDNAVALNQQISINDIDKLSFITSVFEDDTLYYKAYNQFGITDSSAQVIVNVKLFENTFAIDSVYGDVAWGDYDNDGLMDFASTAGIYHNTGNGFERLDDSTPPSEHVMWADVNNDGWLDCLFDGYVLVNLGTGHFAFNSALVEAYETGVAVGDINNDNYVDYYLSGSFISRVYYNVDDAYSIDSLVDLTPGYRTGSAAFGDFNNDGWQDVVTMGIINGNNTRETNLYLNEECELTAIQSCFANVNVGSVTWGDYDNDGDLDLLLCGSEGTSSDVYTCLYDNYGGGTFVRHEDTPFAALFRGEAIWYDFDNDGYLDVLESGLNSGTRLYRNVNGVRFEEVNNTGLPELSYSSIDVADYDGDGFEDIVLSGLDNDYKPHLLAFSNGYGNAVNNNNQISVPSNLESNVQGTSVTLSWEDVSYATYNLYVRNANGFIVSPLADIATGFRKVTGYGNTGYSKNYTLRGLPEGTYQWSVQSVDKTRKGGAFANEQTFVIVCDHADQTIVYDTACYMFESDYDTYYSSGVYYEFFVGQSGCDSIIERHVTINHDCTPIIYVRMDGDNANSGCSWNHALSDLQLAIDKANEINGNVWVAQGTYYGDGTSENAFYVPNIVQLYGGFAGDEPADYDLSMRDFAAHPTIVDGQSTQRTVFHEQSLHNNSVLDGFTVQNGYTDSGQGGNINGMGCLLVRNCIVQNGEAHDAGGICDAAIVNSLIVGNISHNWAGAIAWSSAVNCVFVNNVGVVSSAATSSLTNCILWNNGGYDEGLTNTITYSAVQGSSIEGESNIVIAFNNDGNSLDSLYVRFVDPENGDFRLSCGSACINMGMGDITWLGLPEGDLQGNPRVMDGRIDMGAYEFDPSSNISFTVTVSSDPGEGGVFTGEGDYSCGQICSLATSANDGYFFLNWTENGVVVSTETNYSFFVTEDHQFVANFAEDAIIDFVDENVKNICVEHWDSNGDGELSCGEAATVTSLDNAFGRNGEITSFDELQYFSNLALFNENEFSFCSGLTSIVIPKSVFSIGWGAFEGCNNLTQIVVDSDNVVYDSRDNCNAIVETATNTFVIGCAGSVIPNTVVVIGGHAFYGRTGLFSIEIPNSVEYFEDWAFGYCCNLASVIVQKETPPDLGWGVFVGVDHSIPVYVPCGSDEAYNAISWGNFSNIKDICPGVVTVVASPSEGGSVSGGGSYDGGAICTVLAAPSENYFFMNWTEDGTVVSTDPNYSFVVTNDRDLVAGFIEDGIIDFADIAVKSICVEHWDTNGDGELSYAEAAVVTSLDNVFSCNLEITSFDELQYLVRLNSIEYAEFFYCSNLTSIVLPDAVVSIEGSAFEGCNSLTSIKIPSSVTSFGFCPFRYCTNLMEIVVDTCNPVFDSRDNCNAIVEAATNTLVIGCVGSVIPNTVRVIGESAFNGCDQLSSIVIPNSVDSIGVYSFVYCYNIASITVLGETPPSLGWGAFEGVDHSIPVYVPCGSLTAYQNAEGWNEFTNFIEMCPGVISVVADPLEGGSVTGGGEYFCGETCTLTASPYFGYHFVNWTENGEEVSTDAAYSFIVSGDRNLSANFAQIDYHWSVDINQYPDNMSVVGIIQIEGVEQFTDSIELGAFSGEECRGRERPVYSPIVDRYLLFMTLFGEEGDELTFRLYDHRIGEELDMVCTNHIDFVINGSVGTPFDPYVFVFEPVIIQTTTFIDGWNWWSSFVEQEDLDGLQMLKDGLGEHGNMIKSQSAFIQYNGNGWSGSLNAINNESTYFVLTDGTCTVDIAGAETMPSAHPITINPGWTWIGYPCRMALPLSALFSNITPSNGDIVKTQNGFVQYRNGEWFGSVNTITPGTGLLYNSNGNQSLTLVYPDDTRAGELLENVTADNNHWVPDVHTYPYNMTVTAVVELDGEELRDERYELAAFANGECRGSARLAYVATLDRYMAFLTIAGDEAADLVLGLYDTETGLTCFGADNDLAYQTNAVVGDVEMPFVVGFHSPTGTDEIWSGLKVFPNPADKGAVVSLATPESRQGVARVEIVNALGVVVEAKEVASLRSASVRAPEVSGVYVIRITIDGVGTHCRKLVVR